MANPGPTLIKGPTPPAEQKRAAELADQARQKTDAGEHAAAAKLYLKALGIHWYPPYLFKAAEAYDRGGDLTNAAEHYRRYVFNTGAPDPQLMRRANARVREIEAASSDGGTSAPRDGGTDRKRELPGRGDGGG